MTNLFDNNGTTALDLELPQGALKLIITVCFIFQQLETNTYNIISHG